MCVFWEVLLERFHKANGTLQIIAVDTSNVTQLYSSLINYVESLRNDNMLTFYVDKAQDIVEETYEYDRQRNRKRKHQPDENRYSKIIVTEREKLKAKR